MSLTTTVPADPVTPAAFAARLGRLGPFERPPVLAVALSGGADSMALTLLADIWARDRGGHIVALTVDHGLRSGSAAEAAAAGASMAMRGIAHAILRWDGPKSMTGLQQAARTARYALLEDWCARHGVLHLLLAHHADDQRETVAFRTERGSGPDGLAGMAAVRERDQVRLLRPLLDLPKASLEATCRAFGQDWIIDPSNHDPRFARTRLRLAPAGMPATGMPATGMPATGGMAGAAGRVRRDGEVAAALARHAVFHPEGWVELGAGAVRETERAVAARILARCCMAVGGTAYPPRGDRLGRLLADLTQGASRRPRTLAGCTIVPARDGWRILREPSAVAGPVTIASGGTVRWDGRFLVRWRGKQPAEVGALGPDAWARLKAAAPFRLPAAVGRTLPALWRNGAIHVVPHLGIGAAGDGNLDCDAWFSPTEPAAGPRFSVV